MNLIKTLAKFFFNTILYYFYNILVKRSSKDKKTIPKNYVYDVYESFTALEDNFFQSKTAIPYVEVNNFNRQDLNRPYEVISTIIADKNDSKTISHSNSKEIVLPIAVLDNKDTNDEVHSIKISNLISSTEICLKYKNRIHYLPIKSDKSFKEINIKSKTAKLAIGNPILCQHLNQNPNQKLVVHIFVDALSKIILDSSQDDVMPNTKSFFSDGKCFENSYSQADWTLSSMSGVFTGKYTKDHLIYHPRRGDKISSTTIAEALSNEEFLTCSISSIPKLTPINGFDRGFKRSIVAPFKDANYIINEAIEQLDSFNGNQYLFLGFFDIHEAYRLQPISSQLKNKLSSFQYKEIKKSNNLFKLYDEQRLEMYKNSLTHFDTKLLTLYKKIKEYDEDATVVLHSDHGVDFITKNTQRLSKERQKVPLMIRGRNIKPGNVQSVKEIRDIPNLIFQSLGKVSIFDKEKSDISLTESIYPNQEYELSIRDNEFVLFFQVPWACIKNRVSTNYEFKTSFCLISNELDEVSNNERFKFMLDIAKKHYAELIIELIRLEG